MLKIFLRVQKVSPFQCIQGANLAPTEVRMNNDYQRQSCLAFRSGPHAHTAQSGELMTFADGRIPQSEGL